MLIRCAFVRGRVKPGQEAAFSDVVQGRLTSLWARFPEATEVRVLRQEEADVAEPHLEPVLAIRYPDRAAMDRALASEERRASRAAAEDLVAMFDRDICHTLFRAQECPVRAERATEGGGA